MKSWRIFFIIALCVGLAFYYQVRPLVAKVEIHNVQLSVEVAATEQQKQKGLGGRSSLALNQGMLFPYDHKEQYNFWMKDMQFPLDFIWIDGNTIVDITENVLPPQPGERPAIVKPKVGVNTLLEVNAGTARRLGIMIGDTVTYLDR